MITTIDNDTTAELPVARLPWVDVPSATITTQAHTPRKLGQLVSTLVYGATLGLLVCIVGAIVLLAQVKDPVVGVPDTTLPPATIPDGIGLVAAPLTGGGVVPATQGGAPTATTVDTSPTTTEAGSGRDDLAPTPLPSAPVTTEPATTTAPASTATTEAPATTTTEPATTTTAAAETTTTDCGPPPDEDFPRSVWVRSTMPQHDGTCTWLLVEDPSTRPTVG